jgi:tRNA(Ile)-lysidine synthase
LNPLLLPLPFLEDLQAPIAVACSGGLDSIALLHAICTVRKQYLLTKHTVDNQPQIWALYIDHGIHPDSTSWGNLVRDTAMSLNAQFDVIRVQGLSSNMPNLENAARNARHYALEQLCKQHGIATLLFAHHANDQAETVLLNLCRGTGLNGIGMPATRHVNGILWLRPWLSVTRKDILNYAIEHHLKWIEDTSNTDESLRRNAIRHSVWPILEQVEPRALSSLLRFAQLAQGYANTEYILAINGLKSYFLETLPHSKEQGLDWLAASNGHDLAIQASFLRAWLAYLTCKPASKARLYAMIQQLNAKTGNNVRCQHDGWEFKYRYGKLWAVQNS